MILHVGMVTNASESEMKVNQNLFHLCVYMCVCVCKYGYMSVCIFICTFIYVGIVTNASESEMKVNQTLSHLCVCMYVCMCVCMYMI